MKTIKKPKIGSLYLKIVQILNPVVFSSFAASLILAFIFVQVYFSSLLNNNILKVLNYSQEISRTYYEEHKTKILSDIELISGDLTEKLSSNFTDAVVLKQLLEGYSNVKDLNEAAIFIPSRNLVLAKTSKSFSIGFDSIQSSAFQIADVNTPILVESSKINKIRAIIKLRGFQNDAYLVVGRFIDPKTLEYLSESQSAVGSYEKLVAGASRLRWVFLFGLLGSLLILVVFSKFLAQFLTRQLIRPLDFFVKAMQHIARDGHLLEISQETEILEINLIIDSFNAMIQKLIESQKSLEEGKNFTDSILANSPVGLVVISKNMDIVIENKAASEMLNTSIRDKFFQELFPALSNTNQNRSFDQNLHSNELKIYTQSRFFLLRFTNASLNNESHFLIIFSDITEHISYERNLLWIAVAKRLTHEIKNPLTPITLATERLEENFHDQISKDAEQFARYLDTIKRHTARISKMIEEFIDFGRLPELILASQNLTTVIRESVSLAEFSIDLAYELKNFIQFEKINILCDKDQLSRAFMNIFKNAFEAMQDLLEKKITISLSQNSQNIVQIEIADSGPGFPNTLLNKITEPYVSTKPRGTGLGLSIASKIIADHSGKINFRNASAPEIYGIVMIELPIF